MAEEFGVSVGTVRKVLDELVANHLVERKKGRGTFVTAGDRDLVEWRFYRLQHPNNRVPTPGPAATARRRPTGHEMSILSIGVQTDVFHILRVRQIDATPIILESIVVPADYVPGIDELQNLPLFMLSYYYERYGVIIERSEENITAVAASDVLAVKLEVEFGAPILRLQRILFELDRTAVRATCEGLHGGGRLLQIADWLTGEHRNGPEPNQYQSASFIACGLNAANVHGDVTTSSRSGGRPIPLHDRFQTIEAEAVFREWSGRIVPQSQYAEHKPWRRFSWTMAGSLPRTRSSPEPTNGVSRGGTFNLASRCQAPSPIASMPGCVRNC